MKKILIIKTVVFFTMLVFCSCSKEDENKPEILSLCSESETRIILNEAIPATVKAIKEGEYFFDGNRRYREVDAQAHLPELASEDNISTIRIFAPENRLEEIGSEVMIKGTIYTCVSGAHGRLTNNLHLFYLIKNLTVTK